MLRAFPLRFCVFLAAAALPAFAETSLVFIDTIAGATNFNNTQARQTPFIEPQAVWVSPNGDLYVSDGNFLVWRVSGGVSKVIAGGGNVVDDSLPVPALRAKLDFPYGIVGGSSGEIYISDVRHNRIRRINTDGTIVTVVGAGTEGYSGDGGRATFAELDEPIGLALSPSGQLYIADSQNCAVRRYDPRTGLITTFAGTGVCGNTGNNGPATRARIGEVRALALDGAGNLYLSDSGNNVVRKVDVNGNISTVAGNGKRAFSGDGGQATQASIGLVEGLAVDSQNNLYLADFTNKRIRRVTPAGVISTYAGQTTRLNRGADDIAATSAYIDGPNGIALDTAGNLFIAEDRTNVIRRVDAKTGTVSTAAGSNDPLDGANGVAAPLIRPTDVATDSRGNVYIADNGHFRIRRLDARTGAISTVAGDGVETGAVGSTDKSIGGSMSISIDPQDRILIADAEQQAVLRVDPATGVVTTIIDLSEDDSQPAAVVADRFGNRYVSDRYYHQIYRWSADGKFSVLAGTEGVADLAGDGGPAVNALLNGPEGLVLDGNNGLIFCDRGNHVVRRIDLTTGIITRFAGDGLNDYNYDGHPAVEASLMSPIAITTNGNGWVYIADSSAHQIRVVDPDGYIDTLAGSGNSGFAGDGGPAVLALFDTPLGLSFHDGQLYVCDSFNYRIRKLFVKDIALRLQASPTRFDFHAAQGGASPSGQLLILQSSYVGLDLDWSLDAPGFTGGWLYATYLKGSTPDVIVISVDPTGLAPGTYTANMVLSSSLAPDVRIPITLTIDPPNVASAVILAPALMTFTVPRDGSDTQALAVTSPGSNPLDWRIRLLTSSPWLKFSATSGTTPSSLSVTASAAGLEAGSYTAVAYFQSAQGVTLMVVTMVVSAPKASMVLDRDVLVFEVVEGSTRVVPQTVRVFNNGSADLSWDLAIPADAAWVRAAAVRGTSGAGGAASEAAISVDPSGLRAGAYNATLTLRAAGALGSPQLVTVRLKVASADTPAKPVFSTTGLVFRAAPGNNPPEQSIEIGATGGGLSYSAKVSTTDTVNWLSVSPLHETVVSSAQKVNSRFLVVTDGLKEGVHSATVQYSFSDGSVQQISVLLILRPGAATAARNADAARLPQHAGERPRDANCSPSQQVMVTTSLGNNFFGSAGWPLLLRAEIYDDCGTPLTDSTVTASFSSNDPAKTLTNLRNGQYIATWTPRAPAAAVTVNIQSTHPVMPAASIQLGGTLTSEANPPPVLFAGGVLNAASRRNASVISPGANMALTGAYFPSATSDATVLVNGSPATVISSNTGEIRMLAPADFAGASRAAVIVRARGIATSAELVTVVPVDPGLFPPAQNLTASAGGTLSVTATGLGPAGADGKAPVTVTAQFDDINATVQSATAAAGNPAGVYTLQIAVPAGASGQRQLTIQAGGVVSNAIPVTVQ